VGLSQNGRRASVGHTTTGATINQSTIFTSATLDQEMEIPSTQNTAWCEVNSGGKALSAISEIPLYYRLQNDEAHFLMLEKS